jgi:hypothetical protein
MSLNHQFTIVDDIDKRAKIERVVNMFIKPRFILVRNADNLEMEIWNTGVYGCRYANASIFTFNTVCIQPITEDEVFVDVTYHVPGAANIEQTTSYQWMLKVQDDITCQGLTGCVRFYNTSSGVGFLNYFPTPEVYTCLTVRHLQEEGKIIELD